MGFTKRSLVGNPSILSLDQSRSMVKTLPAFEPWVAPRVAKSLPSSKPTVVSLPKHLCVSGKSVE
ncbi:hypothetical protein VE03_00559 [Pseudogymnoascus sp. 23342-1-I1]|nr:hypothetical protein VE03_00559 [Pseudogymnoascus sp. 23342-1-I1]